MPCHRAKGTLDNFFWPGGLHQVGALKKPPGSTWVHLGRPGRERATDIDIHLVHAVRSTPRVDFGQIGRLGS